MSVSPITTAEVSDIIISELETSLNQNISILPKSFSRVLAKTLAGVFVLLYRHVDFGILQMFAGTASDQEP